jgi:hypothetical protein
MDSLDRFGTSPGAKSKKNPSSMFLGVRFLEVGDLATRVLPQMDGCDLFAISGLSTLSVLTFINKT